MNNNVCFYIEGKELYLEQVLVDYMHVPIFFVCKNNDQFYIAQCTDFEESSYIIVNTPLHDLYNLLHEKIPMRDIILKQSEYWEVFSGDEISKDTVNKHPIDDLDISLLPEENAKFKVLTETMRMYVQKFDSMFLEGKHFSESSNPVFLDETVITDTLDMLIPNIIETIMQIKTAYELDKKIISASIYDKNVEKSKNTKNPIYKKLNTKTKYSGQLETNVNSSIFIAA